ncbi:MAG: hypothetical protein ABWY93_20945 [Mycobacterium sp.]
MIAALKKIYEYEMTIAEWIGLVILLAAPYLAIGVIWSITHSSEFSPPSVPDFVLWFVKSTLTWPWLMFSSVLCLS